MNKVPVLVGDVPGFVMNRVAGAFYAMAGHLLVYGAGSVRRIDRVMTDMGFAAGPFAILDGITLPTALKVGEWLFKQVSDRGSAALLVLLRAMLAVGWKGRSPSGSSRGFYTWQNGRQQAVNEEVGAGKGDKRKRDNCFFFPFLQIKSLAQRVRSEMAAAENRAAGGDMLRTLRVPQLSDDDVRDALLLAMLNEVGRAFFMAE